MSDRWTRFWFAPASPSNLGLCRMLFFGGMLLFYLPTDFSAWGDVSPVFWQPIWLFARFHLPMLPKGALTVMQMAWHVALAFSCIGLFTRTMTAVSFALGIYILGLPNNFGTEYHYDTLVVMAFAIMAISRSGDAWSLDRLRLRRAEREQPTETAASGEYTWPIRAIQLVMALIFFAAGIAKIRHSGLAWVVSNTMSIMLVQQQYHIANADPLTTVGLTLALHPWLCSLLAAGSMTLETIYPLALFSARARAFIVPSVFLMQVGIRVLMGPTFNQYLICNLFWVPWDRVALAIRHRLTFSRPVTIEAVPQ